MKKKSFLMLPLIVFSMLIAACHGTTNHDTGGGDNPPTETIEVTSVSISPTTLSLEVGEKGTLKATVLPDNATNKKVIWSSSDSSVATVNSGIVTGVKAGNAVITAKTNNDKTATANIVVTDKPAPTLTGITVTGQKEEYEVGDLLDIVVTANYSDGSSKVLSSSEYTVSGFDTSAPIESIKVTVSYQGQTFEFNISVKAKQQGPVDPTKVAAAVVINNVAYELSVALLEPGEDTSAEKYHVHVDEVKKDQTVVFYYDGQAITSHIGLNPDDTEKGIPNNADAVEEGSFVIRNDAEDVDVYFFVYKNENPVGHSFWISGGTGELHPVPVVKSDYLNYGRNGVWETEPLFYNSNTDELFILEFAFEEGDEFSICVGQDDWRNFLDAKNLGAIEMGNIVDAEGDYHNFKVLVAGEYDIYVAMNKGDQPTVYVALSNYEPPVVENKYGLVGVFSGVNKWGEDQFLTIDENKEHASIEIELKAGDIFKIRVNEDWEKTFGYSDVNIATEGAIKLGEENNNIEVIRNALYTIVLNIKTGKLSVDALFPVLTPTSLEATYSINGVVGQPVDPTKWDVRVVYSDESKSENIANQAHYYVGEVEATLETLFPDAESITITVKYTVGETTLTKDVVVAIDPAPVEEKWVAKVNGVDEELGVKENGELTLLKKELAANDTVIFQKGEETRGYSHAKEGDLENINGTSHFEAGENNEFVTKDAGTYSFYIDLEEGIWIVKEKVGDLTGWKAVINDEDVAVNPNPDNLAEFQIIELSLLAGAKITFTNGTITYDFRNLKTGCSSLFNEGENHELVIKEDGKYSFYVDVTMAIDEQSIWGAVKATASTNVDYVLTNTNSWDIFVDGAKVYAWVWGGNYGSGEWIPCTRVSDYELTFTVDSSATSCKIVRFASSVESPDWSASVWNQSGDISLAGTPAVDYYIA